MDIPLSASPPRQQSDQAWNKAYELHGKNFVSLVSRRKPPFRRLLDAICGRPPKSGLGYRVSIAEMQRMRLRALQFSLVEMGVNLHLGESASNDGDLVSTEKTMKLLLDEYSTFTMCFEIHMPKNAWTC